MAINHRESVLPLGKVRKKGSLLGGYTYQKRKTRVRTSLDGKKNVRLAAGTSVINHHAPQSSGVSGTCCSVTCPFCCFGRFVRGVLQIELRTVGPIPPVTIERVFVDAHECAQSLAD